MKLSAYSIRDPTASISSCIVIGTQAETVASTKNVAIDIRREFPKKYEAAD